MVVTKGQKKIALFVMLRRYNRNVTFFTQCTGFLLANSELNIGTNAGESNFHIKLSILYYGTLYSVAIHLDTNFPVICFVGEEKPMRFLTDGPINCEKSSLYQ